MEVFLLMTLWTFESRTKLELFIPILTDHNISYEILFKGKPDVSNVGLMITVEKSDYEKAKRLLMIHKRKKTNRHNK